MYGIEQKFSLESARKHPKLGSYLFDRKQHSVGISCIERRTCELLWLAARKCGKCRVAY